MTEKELIIKAQKAMGVTPDGDWGPLSQKASLNFDVDVIATEIPQELKPATSDWFGAPWVGANIDLLGRHETDEELNARYVPEWKLEGLPNYKTLSGNSYAWCSLRENADKRKVGVKGTNSAAAASWSSWGKECPFWFGATIPIRHASGGRHVCDFLYWIDEKNKIAATLDGNKGNRFCVSRTDLSGNVNGHDQCVPGPRWSKEWPDGQLVSMSEVLAKYPNLKVTSTDGGTR